MKNLFSTLKKCMLDGEDVVMVTVLASSGSTPRGAGARMLVGKDGRLIGTIGGGMVEYECQNLAKQIIEEKKSGMKSFLLKPNQVEDLGMICGGDVVVYLQYISHENSEILNIVELILDILKRDEDSWIILDITEKVVWSMGLYSRNLGIKGLEIDEQKVRPFLGTGATQFEVDGRQYYSEPLVQSGKVIIFGGGHVTQELVPILTHIGFRCVVYDDRPEFSSRDIFPMAYDLITADFNKISDHVEIGKNDYVVIMTRGHNFDFIVQKQVLRKDAYYVGVIGSRKKIAAINAKLLDEGIPQHIIDKVYTPIGLSIKAETPAEIAISIAGELIMVRATKAEELKEE
jgi:xanthine dehydrogenase accessory factor